MSNKLISIVGPTAVGKTSFTLKLVKFLKNSISDGSYQGFNIISADSRQVYKDLMITSGADIPPDFDNKGIYFEKENIRLYGLLKLDYQEEWSLAHFKKYAEKIIQKSWDDNRLPIIVGGTGLYHEHLFNDSSTIWIKPNAELRGQLSKLSLSQLQDKLQIVNQARFDQMNNSDQHNPVRLIRAIEVEQSNKEDLAQDNSVDQQVPDYVYLVVGLKDDLETIEEKIKLRVTERFNNGSLAEVENIQELIREQGLNKQLSSATGVKEIQAYLDSQIEKESCLEKWALREYQYAKRQITWWKNKKDIHWFLINEDDWQKKAFKLVNKFVLPEKT
jgi:tRNA dimethylallyltransferase